MKRTVLALSLVVALLTPVAVRADDAQKETITLHPATVAISVAAGEVTLQTIYFTNQSSQEKSFTVLRSDYTFDPKDPKTLVFTDPNTLDDSIQPMLDVTPNNFALGAGQTQELLVRIRPAADTKQGQYKGALFVGQVQKSGGTDSIEVVGRVGSIIGVTVTNPSAPLQHAAPPFSQQPSALIIALLLFTIFAFAGAGLAAARRAQQLRQQQKFY